MKCPRCGLYNLDTALRCDCGYSFETKAVDGPPSPKWSRQRGGCLATYLVLWVIGYLYLLFYLGGVWLANWNALSAQPRVAAIWALSVLALGIFFLLAVWKWKRWAVYGYCATYVLSWLGSAVTGGLSFDLVRDVGMSAVQLLVFLFLVRRAWGLFDPWRRPTLPPNPMRVPEQGMIQVAEVTSSIEEAAPATQPGAGALGCLAIFLASNALEANFIIRTFQWFLDWIPSVRHRLFGSFSSAIDTFAKRHRHSFLRSVLGAVGSGLGVMPLGWIASLPILVVFGNIDTIEAAGWILFFLMVALPFTLGPTAGLLAGVIGRALIRRYPSTRFIKVIAAPPGLLTGFMAGLLVGVLVSVLSSVLLCTQFPAEDAFLKGNANYEKGSLDQAIADYTRAIERDSGNVTAYNNRALAYTRQGNWEHAIADFTRVIELDPNRATAYDLRSYAYGRQGNLEQATADCTKASELDPTRASAYNFCGMAYAEQGNFDQAIAAYAKAIELDPQAASSYNSRGLTYDRQNKLEEAIADYSKAIELDPKLVRAYDNRSFAYIRQGKVREAIADCTKAIELDPKRASAYNICGAAYSEQGNVEQAIAYYGKAIELAPEMPDAYSNRGIAYLAQGELDQAIADFTKAIELSPDWAVPYMKRGVAYRQQGLLSKALADFETCLKLDLDIRDRSRVVEWIVEIK